MLYNPRLFQLEDSLYIPYIYPTEEAPDDRLGFTQDPDGTLHELPLHGDTTRITRGFLVGIGRMAGERMAIIVNHWPSREPPAPPANEPPGKCASSATHWPDATGATSK